MAKVNISLNADLWRQFRIACLERNTTASQAIAHLVEAQLQHWHQERLDAQTATSSQPCEEGLSL